MNASNDNAGTQERRTLWIVLLLSSMALGLVAGVGLLATIMGVGGTIVLLVAFAVMG